MRQAVRLLRTSRPHPPTTITRNVRPRLAATNMAAAPPASADANPLAGPSHKTIATHSGSFHCDEALGCWLLRQTAEFGGATIVRSRDPAVYGAADVVIDVGGVYDPGASWRFLGGGVARACVCACLCGMCGP